MQLRTIFSRSLLIRTFRMLGIVAVATLVRFGLEPVMGDASFVIFLIAMLSNAWWNGIVLSVIGQTLLLAMHVMFFLSVHHPGPQMTIRGVASLTAYYGIGTIVALLSEARRVLRQRMEQQHLQLLAQEQELEATINSIGDGVVTTNRQGRIKSINPVAEAMTGWPSSEALGRELHEIFQIRKDIDGPLVEAPWRRVLFHGEPLREPVVHVLQSRAGCLVPITFNATPLWDDGGEITGAVIILRDESERRRAEDRLREMNRRKDDFLATLAHELRNPLAPIRTGLQLLKLSQGNQTVADEVHDIMERQMRHMIRMVDDLLDISRITRGKMQLRRGPTNIANVVANAVETMRPLIESAGHTLVLKVPDHLEMIDGDADRLTQVACNLLHNSVKYTPDGGRIEVQVEQTEDETRLMVIDNGQGIPPDKLQSIFEMFNQGAEDKEKGLSGLGIGLTLARRLAQLHGGSIEAQSAGPSLGSTFRLRLPTRTGLPPKGDSVPAFPMISIGQTPRRVLVVDDNEDALRTVDMMLCSLGHETRTAHDGQQALDIAESFRPEVVLMDLGMPRLNGYQAVERLRAQPWGRSIVVYALTGWGQERDRDRTFTAGFDGHLVKPVDMEVLKTCLEQSRSCATDEELVTSGMSSPGKGTLADHMSEAHDADRN